MWMLEDMDLMQKMIAPLKKLNLDDVIEEINKAKLDFPYEEVEVAFFPGQMESNKVVGNKLYLNLFFVKPDLFDDEIVLFEGQKLREYIKNQIIAMK